MNSLMDVYFKCNKRFIVNFDGNEFSSDGGLFLIKEFFMFLVLKSF